ncbi:30S ribosome-binding factor RbfA [Chromobacterium piscinae]|uniref:30S ribosome-binding factor RbfA n=1 Tax=Chromobacterium piscinae TaxID=686831 RepID=UPI00140C4309|nr:30S ribosome-binding factor RbfA [Chromobacterium piscinae]MBX9295186.1 30S ribosome-binding factor RbfA [Chromobacterium vaccinii]MBX9359275.1 30S ribosome-binding factor RbfA [Chromobacterium vaccinii]MCD4503793.1 30S ribosome-binding factor RbfA [Chromobacterium piscinae]MCD5330274.1 30S ribosome-binding factor RbfA [Chromobacterium piscinae]NHQ84039.1 30S ribosome-binding factor RbfA [Chromobacterium vaccinii]
MAKAKKGFSRSDRIAEQIQRELAELTRKGLKDPRAGWITITAVEVTRDYSHAKVYYTVMVESTREATQEALDSSAGYLRNELGRAIKMFSMPQLHFVYDDSVERGMHLTSLINQVAREDAEKFGEQVEGDAGEGEGKAE